MTTSMDELRARVLDEVKHRGGMRSVMDSQTGPGECVATALFSVKDEYTDEQFSTVFALGMIALVSVVFGITMI